MARIHSRYVNVDGIRTHYLEGGDGPIVVLIHSAEFGGCAELSWEFNLGPLAEHFRVIAPDLLGFGRTDKLIDFNGGAVRRMAHLQRFLAMLDIREADFVGNSMGGGLILRAGASDPPTLPIRRMVAAGGGFAPLNDARWALLNYDCTREGMIRLIQGMFVIPRWWEDEAYVQRRIELSLLPGAWEATAAARFKSPAVPAREQMGQPDTTPYEKIKAPTLVIAGGKDPLRNPGYVNDFIDRIPTHELIVYEDAGHCPNIEKADAFNSAVIDFFTRQTVGTREPARVAT